MVISDLAKAIPASDSEINNEWVVRNTHRFVPEGELEQQSEADSGSKKGFAKGKEFTKKGVSREIGKGRVKGDRK